MLKIFRRLIGLCNHENFFINEGEKTYYTKYSYKVTCQDCGRKFFWYPVTHIEVDKVLRRQYGLED